MTWSSFDVRRLSSSWSSSTPSSSDAFSFFLPFSTVSGGSDGCTDASLACLWRPQEVLLCSDDGPSSAQEIQHLSSFGAGHVHLLSVLFFSLCPPRFGGTPSQRGRRTGIQKLEPLDGHSRHLNLDSNWDRGGAATRPPATATTAYRYRYRYRCRYDRRRHPVLPSSLQAFRRRRIKSYAGKGARRSLNEFCF